MKHANQTIKSVVSTVKKSDASFDTPRFVALEKFLQPYICDDDLKPLNDLLTRKHLRQLTAQDVIRIAYVHARSIAENNGQSPYSRIIQYFSIATVQALTNLHVKAATELLIGMEFMTMIEGEDRKAKKCRSYSLSKEVIQVINSLPDPK